MGEVINLRAAYNKRKNPIRGNLLPFRTDQHTEGKHRVRITHPVLKRMCGRFAYTDFTEVCPGYFRIYMPNIGYTEIAKQYIVMDD